MNWYYVEQGKQAGPVSDEQLDELIRNGTIQPDSLVWHEGMPDWLPCRQVKVGTASMSATGAPPEPTHEAVCSECGKIFPIDETIRYGNARVCAGCKPVFLQKLQEGADINTGGLNYARFGSRFAAYFLDALILLAFNFLFGLILGFSAAQAVGAAPKGALGLQLFSTVVGFLVGISYEAFLVGKYGATLGKMAMKIKVVTADGGRVSYSRSFGRYFGKMLSSFTCLIGFIMAAFDNPQRRALHDRICNTRVINI